MKSFYSVQTADLLGTPPQAQYHAVIAPGAPQWSLVIIQEWQPGGQVAWEAIGSVTEHQIWNWSRVVPAVFVTAFGPWGVSATDTIAQAFQKIRAQWPACLP